MSSTWLKSPTSQKTLLHNLWAKIVFLSISLTVWVQVCRTLASCYLLMKRGGCSPPNTDEKLYSVLTHLGKLTARLKRFTEDPACLYDHHELSNGLWKDDTCVTANLNPGINYPKHFEDYLSSFPKPSVIMTCRVPLVIYCFTPPPWEATQATVSFWSV